MNEYQFIFSALYSFLISISAFISLYPPFKSFTRGFTENEGLGQALAIIISISAIAYGFFIMYHMIEFFIGMLLILSSMLSGFSLMLRWMNEQRTPELLLFINNCILSPILVLLKSTPLIIDIYKDIVTVVGVIEGTYSYIFPIIKDMYLELNNEDIAYVLSPLLVIICILSIISKYIGITEMDLLLEAIHISDLAFIIGGSLALCLKIAKNKLRYDQL